MLYFVGGAPRVGKTILAQQLAAHLGVGWVSTDLLLPLLRLTPVAGIKTVWNAAPQAITADAEWFFPYLDRFVWGVSAMSEDYVIEGVDFLPTQVSQLAAHYPLRAVFLGCARLTLARLDQFPGRSPGYAALPEAVRQQIAADVPRWSAFIRQEAARCRYPYIDTGRGFPARLQEAEAVLTTGR